MVKLGGPCFSMEARGSFGKAITFANVWGTSYAKRHFTPANPRSPAQTVTRMHTKFVCQMWKWLNTTYRNTWATHPDAERLSLYHAYMIANQRRWAIGLPPAIQYPFGDTTTYSVESSSTTVSGRRHKIMSAVKGVYPLPILFQACAAKAMPMVAGKSNTVAFNYPYITVGGGYIGCITYWDAPDDDYYFILGRYITANGAASAWFLFDH